MKGLSGLYSLGDLLECAGLPRSTYYYALAHPKAPTRPDLWDRIVEIFSRSPNGCGHRQIAMCLRAEDGAVVADKTVLKAMAEFGISCGIRSETDYHRYNSYKGVVGRTFENVLGRDFSADGPWRKLGTDVTEFSRSGGKAYFVPAYEGDSGLVHLPISGHGPADGDARHADPEDPRGRPSDHAVGHGVAVPARRVLRQDRGGGHRPEHVEEGGTASTTARPTKFSTISRTSFSAAGSSPTSTRSRGSWRNTLSIGTLEGGRSNLRD